LGQTHRYPESKENAQRITSREGIEKKKIRSKEANKMDRSECVPQYQAPSPVEAYLISIGSVVHSGSLLIEVVHVGYQEPADQLIKGGGF